MSTNEPTQTNMSTSNLRPVVFELGEAINWEDIRDSYAERFEYAAKLDIIHLRTLEAHNASCIIVGGGPSAAEFGDSIRQIKSQALVTGVNAMHQWLIDRDIIPSIHIVFEPDIEDLEKSLGGPPHPDVTYYIASHCPVHVFKALENYKRVLWHAYYPLEEYQAGIIHYFPGEAMVAGGYCTLFRNISIAAILGFRNFELFGVDSSFGESSHIKGYGGYHDIEPTVTVYGTDPKNQEMRPFKTQGGLACQAVEFLKLCEENTLNLKFRVHGDGLMRYLHKSRYPEMYQTKETL